MMMIMVHCLADNRAETSPPPKKKNFFGLNLGRNDLFYSNVAERFYVYLLFLRKLLQLFLLTNTYGYLLAFKVTRECHMLKKHCQW